MVPIQLDLLLLFDKGRYPVLLGLLPGRKVVELLLQDAYFLVFFLVLLEKVV